MMVYYLFVFLNFFLKINKINMLQIHVNESNFSSSFSASINYTYDKALGVGSFSIFFPHFHAVAVL